MAKEDTASIETSLKEIDRLITEFKLKAAIQKLNEFDYDKVPNSRRAQFAQLCRRVGLDHLSLKLFHPWIHDQKSTTTTEQIEYATCLRKVGLINESLRILKHTEVSAHSLLHKAFCHIQIWDYIKAGEILLAALQASPSESVSRLIRINLVATLVFLNQLDEATNWLDKLEKECETTSLHLVFMCRLFRAQILYRRDEIRDSLKLLEQLRDSTAQEDGPSKLLIEKWLVVARLTLDPSTENQKALEELRKNLRSQKQWETLRGLDLEVAFALNDADLATRIYFGTPHLALRRKIMSSPLGRHVPQVYELRDRRHEREDEIVINGITGENMPFKFGTLNYRAMMILLTDTYQPWSYFRIFNALFPDQVFDVNVSPKRVHQIARRIRTESERNGLPIEMIATENGYRLRMKKGARFVMFNEMQFDSVQALVLGILRDQFRDKDFSTADVEKVAPIKRLQGQRILRSLASEGHIVSQGGSKRHRTYRLKVA